MRAIEWALVVAAIAVAGCSSDHSGGGRNDMTGPLGSAAAPATGATGGTTAAAAGQTAGPDFGNHMTTGGAAGTTVVMPRDAGGVPVSDGSSCVIGKFCGSDNPDKGCGTLTLASTVKKKVIPGNLLIIFDQSGSMMEMWQNTNKLEAAKAALVAAITPLKDSLNVGAIFLPDPNVNPGCAFNGGMTGMASYVQPIEGTGNIPIVPGQMFIDQFNAHWSMMGAGNGQGTPLNEAFDRAHVAIQNALPMLTGKLAVVVFTDGMPNCTPNATATMIPTKTEPARAADWLAQGVTTYMIGLPGADGVTYLNDIAVNGGTNMYITPDDPMVLADKIKEVVQEQVMSGFDTCSIDLMPPTTTPDKLQLVVEEPANPGMLLSVPHDLGGTAGGWTINTDGSHVELTGGLCDSAKMGRFSRLTFEFGCKDIPPIPPSHVM